MACPDRLDRALSLLLPPAFWLGVWQLGAWLVELHVEGRGNELLLPYPATVLLALFRLARSPEFWWTALASLARIAAGMPYTFPDGKGTVQLRNERDITNVIGVGASGMMLAAAGDTETIIGFRDQEDMTHRLTGAQAQALGQTVMEWISAHYAAAWAHKDAVKRLAEAGDLAALASHDIAEGWPGA